MADASIVLLTYNGERYLSSVLKMILRQKEQPLEIIAVDSGSSDATLEILRSHGIEPHVISKQEFGHSKTRNQAARLCSGKFIVFLTQDAVPADACWLECLLAPLTKDENIVASFSRQIPRPDASLLEANDLAQDFPLRPDVKKIIDAAALLNRRTIWKLIKFSNASSAYKRTVLLNHPFYEALEMAEDQEWVKRVLELGFAVAYEPASVVVHSHDHRLKEKYARSVAMGRAFSMFLHPVLGQRSAIQETGAWLIHMLLDLRYIASRKAPLIQKCKWLLLSPLHRFVTHYAYRKGWNAAPAHAAPTQSSPKVIEQCD